MITIYNESSKKDKKDDHAIRDMVEEFFESHRYLEFTNILVWVKEANPEHSRGPALYDCAVEARLPNQEPAYVSKKNGNLMNGVREALETIKEEIIKKRQRIQDRNHSSNPRPF